MRGWIVLVAAMLIPAFALAAVGTSDGPSGDSVEEPVSAATGDGPGSMEAVWRDTMGSYACVSWSCVLLTGDPAPDHTFPTPDASTEATFTITWTGPAEALRLTVESDDRVRSAAGGPGSTLAMPLGDTFTVTVEEATPFDGTGVRGGSAFAVEMVFT